MRFATTAIILAAGALSSSAAAAPASDPRCAGRLWVHDQDLEMQFCDNTHQVTTGIQSQAEANAAIEDVLACYCMSYDAEDFRSGVENCAVGEDKIVNTQRIDACVQQQYGVLAALNNQVLTVNGKTWTWKDANKSTTSTIAGVPADSHTTSFLTSSATQTAVAITSTTSIASPSTSLPLNLSTASASTLKSPVIVSTASSKASNVPAPTYECTETDELPTPTETCTDSEVLPTGTSSTTAEQPIETDKPVYNGALSLGSSVAAAAAAAAAALLF
ncbi:hypothetical protein BDZ88DRAFT_434444 [Geranomyces variabilis]|nr:hypothetical protein BDZ88DRAFT_434444 [Geranomyces variabilis]KAJ3140128.1 hypothetical protein HDU90_008352 [Geranomyces variabilis]